MPEGQVCLQTAVVDGADAPRHPIDLGVVPCDGERDGSVEQHVEIVSVVSEFPEIVAIEYEIAGDLLLEAAVELIPCAWLQRYARPGAEYVLCQPARTGRTRKQQVLVEGRFHSARISRAQHGAGLLHHIGKRQPRLW